VLKDLSTEEMLKTLNIIPRPKKESTQSTSDAQQHINYDAAMRIKELEEEIAVLKSQSHPNHVIIEKQVIEKQVIEHQVIENQVNQTVNQTVIINVNPFSQETMDHIADEEIANFLKQYKKHFIDMMNRIYELPEKTN